MARTSFVIRQTPFQSEPPLTGDNDSALKGDGYVASPDAGISTSQSYFDVKAIDYGKAQLSWGIGTVLQTTVGVTPVPTQVVIRYDTLGEPQTVANGSLVTTIYADRVADSITQENLPEGVWVYYSLFVRYDSTDVRSWYEKIASVKVLMPARLNSREMLWRRIPMHHRLQDGSDSGTVSIDSDLFATGPLYRMMDVIGWDIDKLRTLINHQMVTRDPYLATPEALDALAEELGVPLSSQDLGTTRLRDLLSGINYLRAYKGTAQGVREWVTAITGSDAEIRPTSASVNALTAQQSNFSTIVVNTNPAAQPTGNQWVIEPVSGGTATSGSYGVQIVGAGASYGVAVLKTRISDTKNDSWYRMLYDLTVPSGASVIGVQMSTSVIPAASVTVDPATGEPLTYPNKFVLAFSGADTWYEAPVEIGLAGDGTHTTTPMFLHIFVTAKAGGTVNLNNIKLRTDDRFPYFIDVFSQRVNLCRDPKFVTGNYWGRTDDVVPPVIDNALIALDPKYSPANVQYLSNTGTGKSDFTAYAGPQTGACISNGSLYTGNDNTNLAVVQDFPDLRITGDIEFVARVASNGWSTQGGSGDQPMIAKPYGSGGYSFIITNSAIAILFSLATSPTVISSNSVAWSAGSRPANGVPVWIKATRTTAGSVAFYTAADQPTEPTSWTLVGTTTGASGSLTSSTTDLQIGPYFNGRIFRTIIRNGINGPKVLDADFSTQSNLVTSFTDSTGKTVSVRSSGAGFQPKFLPHTGTNYINIPSGSAGGDYVSITADEQVITGDIEMVCRWAADNWKTTTNQPMIVRRAASPNYGWYWLLSSTSGVPTLNYTVDGSTSLQSLAASVPAFVNGTTYWHKVTRRASTGVTSFFYANDSANEPTTWIQIATINNGASGGIYPAKTTIDIGGNPQSGQSSAGKWYRAIVRSGIGASATTVVDTDFTTGVKTGDELFIPVAGTASSVGALTNALVISNLGTAGSNLDMRGGSTQTGIYNTSPDLREPRYLAHTGTNYLYLPNVAGNYATAPHNAAYRPTTSMSIRFALACDDWSPAAASFIGGHYEGTTANRSYLLGQTTSGTLTLYLSSDGSTFVNIYSTVAVPFADGAAGAIRADWIASGTVVRFYTKPVSANRLDDVTSDTGWTQLGTDVTVSVPATLFGATAPFYVAGYSAVSANSKSHYASAVKIDGALQCAANFTTGITSGGQTTFTESSSNAATVTINRSTSGTKAVCVTRPLWLFGNNGTFSDADYLTTARSHSSLDVSSTDSLTVVGVMRQWATPISNQYLISKRDATNVNVGWSLANSTTTFRTAFTVDSGATHPESNGPTFNAGQLLSHFGILDRSTNTVQTYTGASTGGSVSAAGVGTLTNTVPLTIGRIGFSDSYLGDMEFYGAAIWKRVLTAEERTLIRNYFDGTETPEALSLLAQSVFWIDPKRSVQKAAIVRNSIAGIAKAACVTRPVLLFDGADDYLEIPNNPYDASWTSTGIDGQRVVTPYVSYLTGTATAGSSTSTTLVDNSKSLTQFRYSGLAIRITGGTGAGQTRNISSNGTNSFSISGTWSTIPDGTSTYIVESTTGLVGDIEVVVRYKPNTLQTVRGIINKESGWRLVTDSTDPTKVVFGIWAGSNWSDLISGSILSAGTPIWIKVTRNDTTGATIIYWAPDQKNEPTAWTISSSGTIGGSLLVSSQEVEIGARNGGYGVGSATFYRAIVRRTIGGGSGSAVLDWSAAAHSPGPSTTTDVCSNVWTINGGTLQNTDPLNVGETENFTLIAVIRQQVPSLNFGRYVSKRSGSTYPYQGWELASYGTQLYDYSVFTGSSATITTAYGLSTLSKSGAIVEGQAMTIGMVVNRGDNTLRLISGNTVSTQEFHTTAVASVNHAVSNNYPVRIGISSHLGGGPQSFELLGLYIWKRVLTQSELDTVVAHATAPGTVVSYSPSGSFGASASTAASVSFYSIGNTPIRQGIPYYFSVTDVYNNITSVELWSNTYGQLDIATATSYQKNFADGARRKTWELTREYSSPWLPLNLNDCYIKINGNTDTTRTIVMKDPLFEPLNTSGEYFDGNNVNGGWLSGATASSGVADYRWGDAGANISFSYYTSDYQRTVSTLFRLLDTILPVTQTGNNTSLVKLDRIYGYTGTDRP